MKNAIFRVSPRTTGQFPSYSADGKQIVYRVWGEGDKEYGLRILNVEDRTTRVLTTGYDNLTGWSPHGSRILFTRRVDASTSTSTRSDRTVDPRSCYVAKVPQDRTSRCA
jgi:Tol biopolymer transport system component